MSTTITAPDYVLEAYNRGREDVYQIRTNVILTDLLILASGVPNAVLQIPGEQACWLFAGDGG